MLIPSSAPLSACHPFTPTPPPPPLPTPLVRFPELGVFMFCLPFWYFLPISSPFPSIPFHYYLYSPNEWEHIMFVLLRLTYFTQHNTLQLHPLWSKWWVFVISNSWVIFHLYIDHIFFIHSSFDGNRGSFHSLAIVDIAAGNIGVQVSRRFNASETLGSIPSSAIAGS